MPIPKVQGDESIGFLGLGIITLPLRAWCVRASPEKSLDFIVTSLFTCLVFVSVKPRNQTHVREGGIARCFLIDVVCILYVCVFVPIRNWRQEQKFGPRSRLQRLISSILRHNFRRSLSFPVS